MKLPTSKQTPSKNVRKQKQKPKQRKLTTKKPLQHSNKRHMTTTSKEDVVVPAKNSDPGHFVPENFPKVQHVVSPHLRKHVDEVDETPVQQRRAPIDASQLTVGYRYVLRHLKYVPEKDKAEQLRAQFRGDFDLLARSTSKSKAEVQFDRSMPNIWSRLSVLRMNISKLRRPKIPEILSGVAEYLGAQEGSGWFCAVPNTDDRFNRKLDNTTIVSKQSEAFQQKAKLYNMDLHPADVQRHYDLVERFHFNGKERAHNRY